jgi:hypothetical protein
MNNNRWPAYTNFEVVRRRSGGRNRYHALRRFWREERRCAVMRLLGRYGWDSYGVLSRIARKLGVHRSTITRDVQALLRDCETQPDV